MSNLFKMINVKDHEDGSFTIEWDENDPQESIFNGWTKDFVEFFTQCAKRENAKESGEESEEDYYNSESEGKDYIKATNEETFGIEGDELSED